MQFPFMAKHIGMILDSEGLREPVMKLNWRDTARLRRVIIYAH